METYGPCNEVSGSSPRGDHFRLSEPSPIYRAEASVSNFNNFLFQSISLSNHLKHFVFSHVKVRRDQVSFHKV
jgi:hypothetical protein